MMYPIVFLGGVSGIVLAYILMAAPTESSARDMLGFIAAGFLGGLLGLTAAGGMP